MSDVTWSISVIKWRKCTDEDSDNSPAWIILGMDDEQLTLSSMPLPRGSSSNSPQPFVVCVKPWHVTTLEHLGYVIMSLTYFIPQSSSSYH